MLKLLITLMAMALLSSAWTECVLGLCAAMSLVLVFSADFSSSKMGYGCEIDLLSSSLILLSIWIGYLSILASTYIKLTHNKKSPFIFLVLVLTMMLCVTFSVSNYMGFYVGFEASLIPVFFVILGWGYQPERAQAGIYMLLYTVSASMPLLVSILLMSPENSYMHKMYGQSSTIISLCMVGAFLVKFPMYSVHLWLPKAHVEAPVAGSMLLAGVLLKLGGYGMVRMAPLCSAWSSFSAYLIPLSMWGSIRLALMCLRTVDIKSLIAYSSVVHMSGCLCSLIILNESGLTGALYLMIGHGLCSSALFYLAQVVYSRTKSRSMFINKGLFNLMPLMGIWWFGLLAMNMAAPPSLNLLAEVWIMISLVSWSNMLLLMLGLMAFFSAAYSVYVYSLSQHGNYLFGTRSFNSGIILEFLVLGLHFIPLNLLILKSSVLICF
uniref:NADH-ubiquinone oxidoreductase chain 4 n=1 Tax=Stygobromus foliatus TaxID=1678291 RepID=A0A172QHF2_9CRUS|nr:NADH dehydrogenase subunit 4 [Stygobromus foliatus]